MKSEADHYTRDLFCVNSTRSRTSIIKSKSQASFEYSPSLARKTTAPIASNRCTWCGFHVDKCSGICSIAQLGRK